MQEMRIGKILERIIRLHIAYEDTLLRKDETFSPTMLSHILFMLMAERIGK